MLHLCILPFSLTLELWFWNHWPFQWSCHYLWGNINFKNKIRSIRQVAPSKTKPLICFVRLNSSHTRNRIAAQVKFKPSNLKSQSLQCSSNIAAPAAFSSPPKEIQTEKLMSWVCSKCLSVATRAKDKELQHLRTLEQKDQAWRVSAAGRDLCRVVLRESRQPSKSSKQCNSRLLS